MGRLEPAAKLGLCLNLGVCLGQLDADRRLTGGPPFELGAKRGDRLLGAVRRRLGLGLALGLGLGLRLVERAGRQRDAELAERE